MPALFYAKKKLPWGSMKCLYGAEKLFLPGFVGYGQLLPSPLAARGQYAAAVGAGHALTETVFVLSFPFRGLIRTLHAVQKLRAQR